METPATATAPREVENTMPEGEYDEDCPEPQLPELDYEQ